METLYLVRHGQASFGADDYDQLSALGQRQSVRLGEYFKSKGVTFSAAMTGTLKRQTQTFAGICEGMGVAFESERTRVGVTAASAGPPQARPAPSGGRELHAVSERGGSTYWLIFRASSIWYSK